MGQLQKRGNNTLYMIITVTAHPWAGPFHLLDSDSAMCACRSSWGSVHQIRPLPRILKVPACKSGLKEAICAFKNNCQAYRQHMWLAAVVVEVS